MKPVFTIAESIQVNGDCFETIYPRNFFSGSTKAHEGFSCSLENEIYSNGYKYPTLATYFASTKGGDNSPSSLPVELYMPNSNSFDIEKEDNVTIAYQRPDTEDWTDGYCYYRTGDKKYIPLINEEYLRSHMTIIILPADTTEYTKPLSEEELAQYIEKQKGIKTKSLVSGGLITTNVTNSAAVGEEDVLTTTVAAIRVNGTSWCGLISNKLKLAVYRASGDLEFNSDGSLKPSGTCHKPFVMAIGKDSLRNFDWVTGYYLFDDDWDLHEYDQKIYFVSEHNIGSELKDITTRVTIGYKDDKPSVEIGGSANVTMHFTGYSVRRVDNQLSRAAALANITNDLGAGLYNGHTVYRYGLADVVYYHYYTDIQ